LRVGTSIATAVLAVVSGLACMGGAPSATPSPAPEPAPEPVAQRQLLDWHDELDGRRRHAKVSLPPGYDAATPVPVVLALHGGGGDIDTMLTKNGWRDTLDEAGWIGIFPQTGRKGRSDGPPDDATDEPGDVDYFLALLDRAEEQLAVDRARVYVVGFSAGGRGAYLLANRAAGRLSAMAAHSANVRKVDDDAAWTDPKANDVPPISVLHIHGKRDPKTPWEGGRIQGRSSGDDEAVAVLDGAARWADQIGARRDADVKTPDTGPKRLVARRWVAPTGHLVEVVLDPQLKHEWADEFANEMIMAFFRAAPPRDR